MLKRLMLIAGVLLLFGTCAYATTNDLALAPELRNEGLRSNLTRERFPITDLHKEKSMRAKVRGLQAPFVRNDHLVKNDSVKYLANVPMGHVFVEDDGVTYVLFEGKGDDRKGWVIKEKFRQTRPTRVEGTRLADAKVNYFKGKSPEEWKTGILTYEEVGFGEIYENIELNLRSDGKNIEKIFMIDKGGNPEVIKVEIAGAQDLRINGWGDLEIETGIGTLKMTKPYAYQYIDGKRVEVAANYVINPPSILSNERGQRELVPELGTRNSGPAYGFTVGRYDKRYPLIIDPLLASTFIGGDWADIVTGIATDASGNIYITGYTAPSYSNPQVNFPTTPGAYDPTHSNINYDAFVAKFNPSLSTLLASTFLGGNGDDRSYAMKIDTEGNVFIAGYTNSDNFPTSTNAYMTTYERVDAFIAKFSSDLSQLSASTYVRANDAYWAGEWLNALAIDSSGNVYAAGVSDNYGTLPAGGYKTTRSRLSVDAVIVKLNNDLSTLLGATFLGGENVGDIAVSIALDSSGNVFVTGETNNYSEEGAYKNDFPVTQGAYAATYGTNYVGCLPSYIAKLNSSLSSLVAATYVGGPGTSWCGTTTSYGYTSTESIAVGSTGNVYVTGITDTGSYPTTEGAYDRTFSHGSGCYNCIESFISKMDNSLSSLLASTYMGGNGYDYATTMTLDDSGNVYIAGYTSSKDYPTTPWAYNMEFGGWHDGFISRLDANLTKLTYSTFFGGKNDYDEIKAIAVDSESRIIVSGETFSSDFPVTQGAYRTTLIGNRDLFVSKLEEPKGLTVEAVGPTIVVPGEEVAYLVYYRNAMEVTAENTVVLVDVPEQTQIISSSPGGIIYTKACGTKEVFWRLGDLSPHVEGELTLKIQVIWGTPNADSFMMARIGATNILENPFDIQAYLDFVPFEVVSNKILSPSEVNAILNSNQAVKDTFTYVTEKGYLFYNVATQTVLKDGKKILRFHLNAPKDGALTVLTQVSGQTFVEVFRKNSHTIFDQNGGHVLNRNDRTVNPWGTWATHGSATFDDCFTNCAALSIPWSVLQSVYKYFDVVDITWDCVNCLYGIRDGYEKDPDVFVNCAQCGSDVVQKFGGPARAFLIEYLSQLAECELKCRANPNEYSCEWGDQFRFCCNDETTSWPAVCHYDCIGLGVWSPFISLERCGPQTYGNVCIDGECKNINNDEKLRKYLENKAARIRNMKFRAAKDPNAKAVDFKGDVIPGQKVNYTIEYENVGAGTAYDVFIIDKLDQDLDESSLTINNGGTFTSAGRYLGWQIGTLASGQKGSVSFSVNVKNGLPSGTEIINYAEVHFPSAAEITLTNPVVNIVRTIAADPKTVETTSGTPVAIVLSGRDSGSSPLSYRVTIEPAYGDLTGTPPNVTYTSMEGFSGQDEFYYVVSNGMVDSDPARVVIRVSPNPADTNPPEVIGTYPKVGAIDVHISSNPISTNPDQYIPTIEATFSEPIDSTTITSSTFTISGLTGAVSYDEVTRTTTFIPSIPLTTSTTYTARLKTGIKDKNGNSMALEYSWQFTTESPANIVVTLPDNGQDLNFDNVIINSLSSDKIVSVLSTGTLDLILGSVGKTGTHPGEFLITDDKCSGKTLTQFENCTLRVAFQPGSTGTRSANLSIPSNDSDTPTLDVLLVGAGMKQQYTLTVNKSGTGGGTVTGTGISCGSDCSETFDAGTEVTLTAAAVSGSVFAGWSGGGCSGKEPCKVTLNVETTVTAAFEIIPYQFVINPSEGTYGTKVTITGSSFGTKRGKVLIGTMALKIEAWANDTIQGTLLKALAPGSYDVTIKPTEPKGVLPIIEKNFFTVRGAEIQEVEKEEGSVWDQVTVKGSFFGTKKGKVYLECEPGGSFVRKACKVTLWKMDQTSGESEIIFIVPKILPAVCDVVVDLASPLSDAEEGDGFEVKAPVIGSINPGPIEGTITISGNYFGSKTSKVYLGYVSNGKTVKKSCSVVSWSDDEIVFTVPTLPAGGYDVIVTNSVGSTTLSGGFTIK